MTMQVLVAKRSPTFKEAYFGELALLYNSPRQATAVCASLGGNGSVEHDGGKAVLWAIDRDTFRSVVHCCPLLLLLQWSRA
jgi:hypothetical protein